MSGELYIKRNKEFWSVFTVSVEISVSCVSKMWQQLNESKSKIGVKGTWRNHWAGFIVLQMRKWFHDSMFLTSSCAPRSWSMWAGTEQGEQQRKFKGQKTQYQKQRQRLQWQQQSVSLSSTTEGPTKARVPQRSVGSHMLCTASIWQQSSMQADGQSLDWSGQRAKPALRSIYGPPNVSTSTLPWVLICMTSGYFCVWSSDAFQHDLLVLKTLSTL